MVSENQPQNQDVKREWLLAFLWAAGVMLLTTLPYLLAQGWAGAGRVFSGFIWGVDDGNVYLSWIRQAAEGRVLLENQYTTAAQSPHFFSVFLYLLGKFSALTGLSAGSVWAGARIICGIFCLLAFFSLARRLLPTKQARWFALILASLSSGLGWLVVLLGDKGQLFPGFFLYPMDVADGWQAQPEAIVFSSLLLNPLFAFSIGIICLIVRFTANLALPDGWWTTVWVGLLLLVLGNVHGYDIFAMHGLILGWLAYETLSRRIGISRACLQYMLILLLSMASLIWAQYATGADPSYLAKVKTPTLSPRLIDVFVGYGLTLILAITGAACALRKHHRSPEGREWLILILWWTLVGFIVIYLPVPFQRKLIEGLHLPLCLLGGYAISVIATVHIPNLSRGMQQVLVGALVLTTMPSNLIFISECLYHTKANNRTLLNVLAPPVYLSKNEFDAVKWLGENSKSGQVVLSSSLTGNHLPAYTPCKVVAGHWAETLEFSKMQGRALKLLAPDLPADELQNGLVELGVNWVWWGPQERLLIEAMTGSAPQFGWHSDTRYKKVFENSEVIIYSVKGAS